MHCKCSSGSLRKGALVWALVAVVGLVGVLDFAARRAFTVTFERLFAVPFRWPCSIRILVYLPQAGSLCFYFAVAPTSALIFKSTRMNPRWLRGEGLGVVIVKRCVDLHGGRINVESKVGAGTVVTVRLPTFCRIGLSGTSAFPSLSPSGLD
jgi:hypothetical protein